MRRNYATGSVFYFNYLSTPIVARACVIILTVVSPHIWDDYHLLDR